MTRPGVLLYRCRRCGALDCDPRVPDVTVALVAAVHGAPFPAAWCGPGHGLVSVHACGPGLLGVADLVGAVGDGAPDAPGPEDPR